MGRIITGASSVKKRVPRCVTLLSYSLAQIVMKIVYLSIILILYGNQQKKKCDRVREEKNLTCEKIYNEEWNKIIISNPTYSLSQFAEVVQTFYTLKSALCRIRLESRPKLPKCREEIFIDCCLTLDTKKPFLVYQAELNK